MQLIRACRWAAEKPGENPSRPNGTWPGLRNTTSSAIKPSKQTRSPALTASIQVECAARIARSSGPICNLRSPNANAQQPGPPPWAMKSQNRRGGPGLLQARVQSWTPLVFDGCTLAALAGSLRGQTATHSFFLFDVD